MIDSRGHQPQKFAATVELKQGTSSQQVTTTQEAMTEESKDSPAEKSLRQPALAALALQNSVARDVLLTGSSKTEIILNFAAQPVAQVVVLAGDVSSVRVTLSNQGDITSHFTEAKRCQRKKVGSNAAQEFIFQISGRRGEFDKCQVILHAKQAGKQAKISAFCRSVQLEGTDEQLTQQQLVHNPLSLNEEIEKCAHRIPFKIVTLKQKSSQTLQERPLDALAMVEEEQSPTKRQKIVTVESNKFSPELLNADQQSASATSYQMLNLLIMRQQDEQDSLRKRQTREYLDILDQCVLTPEEFIFLQKQMELLYPDQSSCGPMLQCQQQIGERISQLPSVDLTEDQLISVLGNSAAEAKQSNVSQQHPSQQESQAQAEARRVSECCICMDEMPDSAVDNSGIYVQPECRHRQHQACLDKVREHQADLRCPNCGHD